MDSWLRRCYYHLIRSDRKRQKRIRRTRAGIFRPIDGSRRTGKINPSSAIWIYSKHASSHTFKVSSFINYSLNEKKILGDILEMLNNFLDNIFPKEILSGVELNLFICLASTYLRQDAHIRIKYLKSYYTINSTQPYTIEK